MITSIESYLFSFSILVMLGVIPVYEIYRRKVNKIDLLTIFNATTILFLLFPAFMMSVDYDTYMMKRLSGHPDESEIGSFATLMVIIIGYISVVLTYNFRHAGKISKHIRFYRIKGLGLYGFMCITLFIISSLVWANSYGGIYKVTYVVNEIRSGIVQTTNLSFVKRFFGLSLVSSIIFLSTYLVGQNNKKRYLFGFLLSTLFVFVSAFLRASRSEIIIYIALVYMMVSILGNNYRPYILAVCLIISLVTLVYGDSFIRYLISLFYGESPAYLRANQEGGELVTFVKDIQFQYVSLEVAVNNHLKPDFNLRFFKDIYLACMSLIPSQAFGHENPETISFINTKYLTGRSVSLVPPGFFAFGVYSASYPGVIISCSVLGYTMRFVDEVFARNLHNSATHLIIYMLAVRVYTSLILSGEPRVTLQGSFPSIIIGAILVANSAKIVLRRRC